MADLDVRRLLRDFSGCPDNASQATIRNARRISMLSEDVLSRLYLLASHTIGPGVNSMHDAIRTQGAGRYSHSTGSAVTTPDGVLASTLYFSTSDNSDPNENGRRYSILVDGVETALVDV